MPCLDTGRVDCYIDDLSRTIVNLSGNDSQ